MLTNDCCWFSSRHSSCVSLFKHLFTNLNLWVFSFTEGFSAKHHKFSLVFIPPFNLSLFLDMLFFSLVHPSIRLTLPHFVVLSTPPFPTSHVHLPIKIHFFHFSPESDIPKGFLCLPISSVFFCRPSSTRWHVFFCHSPSHLSHLLLFQQLILGLSDHLRKEWKAKIPSTNFYLALLGNYVHYSRTAIAIFFTTLFFHVIKPQLRQQ